MTHYGSFRTTRWSLVRSLHGTPERRRAALGDLCERYWKPLYAFARRSGEPPEAAEDAVQGFLAAVIDRGDFEKADPEMGRFRSFLRTAFAHHLQNAAERDRALKRGGGHRSLSLDAEGLEASLVHSQLDPAAAFERAYAVETLAAAMESLRSSYEEASKLRVFEALVPTITAPDESLDRAALAEGLGVTRGALDVAVHRLRARFREALLGAVRDTVNTDLEAKNELMRLREALVARN